MVVSNLEEVLLNFQLILASILVQVEGIDLETMMLHLGTLVTLQADQRRNNEHYILQESRRGTRTMANLLSPSG
jgi:hypothetical protein